MDNSNLVNWEDVLSREFIYEPGCWEKCGSHCCSHSLEEYEFLGAKGEFLSLESKQVERLALDLGEGRELAIIVERCELRGGCADRRTRPLMCQIYPFTPLLILKGKYNETPRCNSFYR